MSVIGSPVARFPTLRDLPYADPRTYGGKPDDASDDTSAIQAAVNGGVRRIEFPPGVYKLSSTIDCTNRLGIHLVGSTWGVTEFQFSNTTGGMVDLTGSEYSRIENIRLTASGTGPEWGILQARSNAHGFSQFCSLDRVYVALNSRPTVNGGYGTIALQKHGAELFRANHCHFVANTALIDTSDRLGGVTSLVPTDQVVSVSNSHATYADCTFISNGSSANGGFGAILYASYNPRLVNPYFLRTAGTTKYAIRMMVFPQNVRVSGFHGEGYEGVAESYLTTVSGFEIDGTFYPDGSNAINQFGFSPNKSGIDKAKIRLIGLGYAVTAVNQGAKKFTIGSDQVARFNTAGKIVRVDGSAANDGQYTVVSATLVGGTTEIVVSEAIPSSTAGGTIQPLYALIGYELGTESNTHQAGVVADVDMDNCATINLPYGYRNVCGKSKLANPSFSLGSDDGNMGGTLDCPGVRKVFGPLSALSTLAVAGTVTANGGSVAVNNSPGSQSRLDLRSSGSNKWQIIKQTDDSFLIYDAVAGVERLSIGTTGILFLNGTSGSVRVGNGSGLLGFYGGAGIAKPTVTGSRGANAALASLLTALASQGLITDSTTA